MIFTHRRLYKLSRSDFLKDSNHGKFNYWKNNEMITEQTNIEMVEPFSYRTVSDSLRDHASIVLVY